MLIHVAELQPDRNVLINGSEDWLAPIYADFAADIAAVDPDFKPLIAPSIHGELRIEKMTDTVIKVTGWISYAPIVPCSRCTKTFPWPLDLDIDVYYQQRSVTEFGKDVTLRKGELEEYYFDGETLDILEVINDTIHTALPSTYVRHGEDEDECGDCGVSLTSDRVFGVADSEIADSPFEVLKSWRTPQ